MRERERIATYFAPLTLAEPGAFFLTDDAAALKVPAGQQLVVTTDSVIEAIHVLPGATPKQFAQKLVRRNLSDLAAMGASPWRYSVNIHTPQGLPDAWFAAFAETLAAALPGAIAYETAIMSRVKRGAEPLTVGRVICSAWPT